jgi:hypothetical protein
MNASVVSGLIKYHAELAGEIEWAPEALRKMLLGLEKLGATARMSPEVVA